MTDHELTAQALARPWSYARVKLGKRLHPKHEAVLRDLYEPGSRVAFRCGNEVGKTSSVLTSAILWHAEVMKGLVVSTAGVARQIEHQLWPNLTLYQQRFPGWKFSGTSIKDAEGRERYVGFTAANEGTFQGFHNLDGPLMIAVDESAAVADQIILAAEERCNPTRFLLMGSPLDPVGAFYQACTSLGKFYKQHKLTQLECTSDKVHPNGLRGWIDPAVIQRKIDKWGAEHPLVLSNVFAEFSLKVEGALLSLREWDACLESPPAQQGGENHVFIDFAAGRAENVIAVRRGNKVWIEAAWREKNTMAAIGECVSRLNRLQREIRLMPHEVEGDADGMGIVFCQALAEAGWPIQHFHGGNKPLLNHEYLNRIGEVWTEGTIGIRKREWILPRDEELKAQIISRKSSRDSKGRLTIESKEDMARRGIQSPDRADAVLGAMAALPLGKSINLSDPSLQQTWMEQAHEELGPELPGADC
jgi:hypothetical protein